LIYELFLKGLPASQNPAIIVNTVAAPGGRPKGIYKRVAEVADMKSIEMAVMHDDMGGDYSGRWKWCGINEENGRLFGIDITNRMRFEFSNTELKCL
jgi:hypothetical protein